MLCTQSERRGIKGYTWQEITHSLYVASIQNLIGTKFSFSSIQGSLGIFPHFSLDFAALARQNCYCNLMAAQYGGINRNVILRALTYIDKWKFFWNFIGLNGEMLIWNALLSCVAYTHRRTCNTVDWMGTMCNAVINFVLLVARGPFPPGRNTFLSYHNNNISIYPLQQTFFQQNSLEWKNLWK